MASDHVAIDLSQLESSEQTHLLDLIDQLRSLGIGSKPQSKKLNLPQLIVCGDQSSGKSSVLNAITRLRFPAQAELCTTFATELRLRRGPKQPISVSIIPGESRTTPAAQQSLKNFTASVDSANDFPLLVEQAREAMRQASIPQGFGARAPNISAGTIFDDVLCVEITKPDVPSLTVVDLPGIIHSPNQNQNAHDKDTILELVRRYMANPRSVILAIVSTKSDLALQVVLEEAQKQQHDPAKKRTFGIITKPDVMEATGEPEPPFIKLANNKRHPLQLGWHVLRNRNALEADTSDAERDEVERKFFQTQPWSDLPASSVGVQTLCERLHRVLANHIRVELPKLREEVEREIEDAEQNLAALGDTREGASEQGIFLTHVSQEIQTLTKDALNGNYTSHDFFVDPLSEVGYLRRLRAVVQNLNDEFSDCMRTRGHKWDINVPNKEAFNADSASAVSTSKEMAVKLLNFDSLEEDFETPEEIEQDDLVKHVDELIQMNRGVGLPGSLPPSTISDLFRQQSERWKSIAHNHVSRVWDAANIFLESLLKAKADSVFEPLMALRVDPVMQERRANLDAKLDELMSPFTSLHPIMHSSDFIRQLEEQADDRLKARFKEHFGLGGAESDKSEFQMTPGDVSLIFGSRGVKSFSTISFASLKAIDVMTAYYKTALEVFICNICTLAVENCLLAKLPEILSPSYVRSLDEEELDQIAGESYTIRFERTSLREKLAELREALLTITGQFRRAGALPQRERQARVTRARNATQSPMPSGINGTHLAGSVNSSSPRGNNLGGKQMPNVPAPLPSPSPTPPVASGSSSLAAAAVSASQQNTIKKPSASGGTAPTSQGNTVNTIPIRLPNADGESSNAASTSKSASQDTPQKLVGGLFNAQEAAAKSPGGSFSGSVSAPPPPSGGLFGNLTAPSPPAATTGGGLFGNLGTTAPPTSKPGGSFGSSSPAPAQTNSTFPQQSSAFSSNKGGLFGNSTAASSSPFGSFSNTSGSAFGAASGNPPSGFGPFAGKSGFAFGSTNGASQSAFEFASAPKPFGGSPVEKTCILAGAPCIALEPCQVGDSTANSPQKEVYHSISAYGSPSFHQRLSFEELRLYDYEIGRRRCHQIFLFEQTYDAARLYRELIKNFGRMSTETRRLVTMMLYNAKARIPSVEQALKTLYDPHNKITIDDPKPTSEGQQQSSPVPAQLSRILTAMSILYYDASSSLLSIPSVEQQKRTLRILRNEEKDTWEAAAKPVLADAPKSTSTSSDTPATSKN